MNYFERRYMGPSPDRVRREKPEIKKLHRELMATGIFLMFALAFFCDTVLEPTLLDPLIQEAQAADLPKTESEWVAEICGDLGRYTNGADYQDYCNSL